jgi:Transglutaminase-like superfamily
MRRVRKFLALAPAERRLLAEAALLVGTARLGLWLLPFRALPDLLGRLARLCARRASTHMAPARIAWAVAAVSSYVPAATCLTQAMAARALLARHGCPAQLRIGVAHGAHGQLEAHAWVEADGRVLIGGAISERYTPLTNTNIADSR